MPWDGVLEAAVALPVPGDVGRRVLADRAARSGPRARRSPRRGRRASRPAGRRRDRWTTASAGSRGCCPTTCSRPRLRDLEAEAGVRDDVDPGRRRPLPFAEDGDVLAAVVGEASQAVEELELGARPAARRRSDAGSAPGGARARAAGLGRPSARVTCSASVPCRLSRTARAAVCSASRSRAESRSFAQDEDVPACLVPLVPRRRLARPDQRLERRLELLRVGVALLVQDHEVDREPLQAPVLVRAEELADDASVLRLVDADQHDRKVAGDPVGPEGRTARTRCAAAPPPAAAASGPRRGSRLARCWNRWASSAPIPRWWSWTCACVQASVTVALEGRRVAILVGERHGRLARRADERREDEPARSRPARDGPAACRLKIGSSTEPVVFESGRPSMTDIGVRMPRPRPRKRPRSVSYCAPPPDWPSTTTTWAAQTAGSVARPAAAGRQQRPEIGDRFGLDEEVGEGRVRGIGRRRRQHELGVGGQLDLPRLRPQVRERHPAELGVVLGRDQHLERGRDGAVAPVDLGAVLGEGRS